MYKHRSTGSDEKLQSRTNLCRYVAFCGDTHSFRIGHKINDVISAFLFYLDRQNRAFTTSSDIAFVHVGDFGTSSKYLDPSEVIEEWDKVCCPVKRCLRGNHDSTKFFKDNEDRGFIPTYEIDGAFLFVSGAESIDKEFILKQQKNPKYENLWFEDEQLDYEQSKELFNDLENEDDWINTYKIVVSHDSPAMMKDILRAAQSINTGYPLRDPDPYGVSFTQKILDNVVVESDIVDLYVCGHWHVSVDFKTPGRIKRFRCLGENELAIWDRHTGQFVYETFLNA